MITDLSALFEINIGEFNCNSIVFFNLKSTLKLDCVLGEINQDFNNPKQRCLTFIMHEMWLKIE